MSDDDDILLPPAGDREWMLDALAELVRLRGAAHLVVAPLLVATSDYLPDRWVGGEASVRRLLRRLMIYADLPYDEVEVEVYAVGDERARAGRPSGKLAGVCDLWLVEARGRRARFAVEATLLGEPEAVAAAAARAVADAFRREHGLRSGDAADEQRRVDLTAVYLGFGRLTADAAHRYAKGGNRPVRQGLLSPKAACFALAAVAVVRDLDRRALKTIGAGLQANQRAFFRRSVELLREVEPPLAARLGLPPRAEWPAAPDLAELTAPLRGEAGDDDEVAAPSEERGIVGANRGKAVFRVERRAGLRIARTVIMGCVMLGGIATRPQMGELLTMEQVVAGAIVLGIAGLLLGSLFRESRCSEPKCGASLRPEMTECPRCGGTIRGSIRHPRERLAAEEALGAEVEAPLSERSGEA
ncbi:MAG: hypothetical protein R3A79_13730 [Nannocystaceae bacterium]